MVFLTIKPCRDTACLKFQTQLTSFSRSLFSSHNSLILSSLAADEVTWAAADDGVVTSCWWDLAAWSAASVSLCCLFSSLYFSANSFSWKIRNVQDIRVTMPDYSNKSLQMQLFSLKKNLAQLIKSPEKEETDSRWAGQVTLPKLYLVITSSQGDTLHFRNLHQSWPQPAHLLQSHSFYTIFIPYFISFQV